jgi:predicted DsbA family dithiol-disulfide isomerase
MISIDIISDTVCPWCYIGKRRLEKAIAERPLYRYQVSWRPFQLNPDLPNGGMARDDYLHAKFGGADRAARVYSAVLQAGREEELHFNFAAIRHQPNTFDSHRLVRWAASAGVQGKVVERLFHRYFLEGADLGDREVLLDIAGQCGMDADLVDDLYRRDADAELVRQEEAVARKMGINGVPCFIVNGKYAVSGAQDPTVLVHVFDLTSGATLAQAAEGAAAD